MPEPQSVAEISSFFAASISIIFGIWYEQTAATISVKMPLQYLDRKPYVASLIRVGATRVTPLLAFLVGYVLIFGGRFLNLVWERDLADFYGGSTGVDACASVFCLIFLVIAYLLAITVGQLWGIVGRLVTALKGRSPGTPRIRLL
jgi:hypothetical protein